MHLTQRRTLQIYIYVSTFQYSLIDFLQTNSSEYIYKCISNFFPGIYAFFFFFFLKISQMQTLVKGLVLFCSVFKIQLEESLLQQWGTSLAFILPHLSYFLLAPSQRRPLVQLFLPQHMACASCLVLLSLVGEF